MSSEITRRGFLQGAAITGGFVAAAGLAACAPEGAKGGAEKGATSAGGSPSLSDTSAPQGGAPWEQVPDPIDDAKIGETIDTEICVVGAGNAGVVAALAAAEAGAKVVVMQNKSTVNTQGTGASAYGTRRQKEQGLFVDCKSELQRLKSSQESGETNLDLLNLWFDKSGEAIDWVCDHAQEGGMDASFDVIENWEKADDWLKTFQVSSMYVGEGGAGTPDLIKILAPQAEAAGAEFVFDTTARQLVQDASGRVTGVIGETSSGEYVKVNASKGVLLCTGGYEANEELKERWLPHGVRFPILSDNNGDGILMGMWVGAAVDQAPHASNIHYNIGPDDPYGSGLPWLRVSTEGKRFCNEDTGYGFLPLQDARLKEPRCFQIMDADMGKYYDSMVENAASIFRTFPPVQMVAESVKLETTEDYSGWHPIRVAYQSSVEGGYAYRADTLEELAQLAGIDADGLKATVERYNELYEKGEDLDYGKRHARMHAVKTPPFYAIPRQAYVLGTLNGLVINDKMQVLDGEGNVIPGLYAAGNASGGKMFGGQVQSMAGPAMTVSRAHTWGYLAGRYMAENE